MLTKYEEYVPKEGEPYAKGTQYHFSFWLKSRWMDVSLSTHSSEFWLSCCRDIDDDVEHSIIFRKPI